MDRMDLPKIRMLEAGVSFDVRLDGYAAIGRAMRALLDDDPDENADMMKRTLGGVAYLGAYLTKGQDLCEDEQLRYSSVLEAFFKRLKKEQWTTIDDPVFSAIYHLLRNHQITREEAAIFAALEISPNRVGGVDSFRKRVDRWVETRHLPKIGQTKRRPRK